MKWLYSCLATLAVVLLYFRVWRGHGSSDVVNIWTVAKPNASFDSLRYRNCSLSTCLRSQRCMLDYDRITVYIQPIVRVVDEGGNVLTPVPSKEFHEIRSMLRPYSVTKLEEACVFFPGIDFLNLYRFPSIEVAHTVADMLNERFYNVLILTLIGQWKCSHRGIMTSAVTPRHLYRHRLDISLPPYVVPRTPVNSVMRHNLVVMLFNASSPFREEALRVFGREKDVVILTECEEQPFSVCDGAAHKVEWENIVQESRFVLLHESMPHFNTALYRALEATVIPVIFAPNLVLPFSDFIDWQLISLQPSSLPRVPDVITSLTPSKAKRMRGQIRKVHSQFSSLHGIVNMTVRVLESRMLPVKARTYEQCNLLAERPLALPHLERATELLMMTWCDASNALHTLQYIRQLTSAGLLSSVAVIWRDDDTYPTREAWETAVHVEIFTGVEHVYDVQSIVKQNRNDVLLIVPQGRCSLDVKVVRKSLNIWRTQPDRALAIPCGRSESNAVIVHKMMFSSMVKGDQKVISSEMLIEEILNVVPSLHVITREHADGREQFAAADAERTSSSSYSVTMQSRLFAVGAIYFLLVANFYNESHGFTKYYNAMYSVWKVIPIVFLALFAAVDGGGMSKRDRILCTMALCFGGIGDVLIGLSHEGIVTGAIAFGIGHIFYMTQFLRQALKINWPLLIGTLAWGAVIGHVCLFPMLNEHPLAVGVMTLYSLTLSVCFALTGSQYFNSSCSKDEQKGLLVRFIGFLLFFVSDSLLIMAHTGYKIPLSETAILGTYYSAQYLILYSNVHTALRIKPKAN